ncbi:M3 family oligoendopeptidase [candidate division WWE3 bacterium]|uniref:M3 family oligoendopeptidase n=1 Tax=candidate division WWE3 bacterium TaxID=2053526 RepID=A0A955LK44_UNCKA|nr:M3 family oligoendopeptidase [candidate division WWE3 bacterium]
MQNPINFKTKWDLSPLLPTTDDGAINKLRAKQQAAADDFVSKWEPRSDYLESPEVLKQALDEYEKFHSEFSCYGSEWAYYSLQGALDQSDPEIRAKQNLVGDFSTRLKNQLAFFELRIAKIPESKQKEFVESSDLFEYQHLLEQLFSQARYLLSEEAEKILNLKAAPAYSQWVQMTSSFLAKETRAMKTKDGKSTERSFSEIMNLLSDTNKSIRDDAAVNFNEILANNVDVAEAELNAILLNKKIDDDLRKTPRPDTERHIEDGITHYFVDTLLEAVSERFDVSHRYYELKAKLFGMDQLAYHERNVPYGEIKSVYTFDQATGLVSNVFEKLDPEFDEIFKAFLQNGQVDVFAKKGKYLGAFCFTHRKDDPTYLLLNHTDKLQDVLTIAHEFGHAINYELMRPVQNSLNFDTSKATTEVASTFMEDFVLEELLSNANDEEKLALMMMKLNEDISPIFRQVAAYRFELELHNEFREQGYVSKEQIGEIFTKHMKSYMGDAVEQSAGSQNWWVYWSHFRSFFYVYSYASGLLISKSLQNMYRRDNSSMERIKNFMRAGTSRSPVEIFADLGIDILDKQFWLDGINQTQSLLKETEQLAKELGKI